MRKLGILCVELMTLALRTGMVWVSAQESGVCQERNWHDQKHRVGLCVACADMTNRLQHWRVHMGGCGRQVNEVRSAGLKG